MSYVIGVGSSTAATKAVVWWDRDGNSFAEAAAAMSGDGPRHEPDDETAARYDRLFAVYRELHPRTQPLSGQLRDALQD